MQTPWGESVNIEQVAEGIVFASTPSHGGYKVSPELLKELPMQWRALSRNTAQGWFEEDCESAIVAYFFGDRFFEPMPRTFERAWNSLWYWYPETCELEGLSHKSDAQRA